MRNAILSVALLFALNQANAQIQNVWVGGMPGRPIDWDVAANWSLQIVPNEFHDVVIPNTSTTTFSYPVIDYDVEINSLQIKSGAKLVILETGKLHLNGTSTTALANAGEIENRSQNPIVLHKPVAKKDELFVSTKKQ